MDQITLFDALLLSTLVVLLPMLGVRDWRRFLEGRERPGATTRLRLYVQTMLQAWLLTFVVVVGFLAHGRTLTLLGLRLPDGQGVPWAVAAVGLLTVLLLIGLRSASRSTSEQREQVRTALGPMTDFMPQNPRERRTWAAMSLTAGVTEEIIYRGYLLWLLALMLPLGWAVVLSSLIFGLQHAYLGVFGIVRTALIGAALSALYLSTGSLLIAIAAHILIDLLQGATFSVYVEVSEQEPEASG